MRLTPKEASVSRVPDAGDRAGIACEGVASMKWFIVWIYLLPNGSNIALMQDRPYTDPDVCLAAIKEAEAATKVDPNARGFCAGNEAVLHTLQAMQAATRKPQ